MRSFLRRQWVLWNGRKMRRLLLPAVVWLLVMLGLVVCARAQSGTYTVTHDGGPTDSVTAVFTIHPGVSPGTWTVTIDSVTGSAAIPQGRYAPVNPSGGVSSYTNSTGDWPVADWPQVMFMARSQTSGLFTVIGPYDVLAPPAEYRIRTSGTNDSEQPVRIGFIDANGDVVFDLIVAPGESWDETIVVDESDGPFTPYVATQNEFSDGVWTQVEIEEAQPQAVASAIPASDAVPLPSSSEVTYTVTNTTVNNTTVNNNTVVNSSANNQASPWINPTPATEDGDRLDKATFRQGVDKLETAIKKGAQDTVAGLKKVEDAVKDLRLATAPSLGDVESGELPEAVELPAPGLDAIPEAPEFFTGTLGSASVIAADLELFGDSFHWSVDFADYASAVNLVRSVLSVALFVGFFLLCVRTARGAGASDS